jgi:hypothetical protein
VDQTTSQQTIPGKYVHRTVPACRQGCNEYRPRCPMAAHGCGRGKRILRISPGISIARLAPCHSSHAVQRRDNPDASAGLVFAGRLSSVLDVNLNADVCYMCNDMQSPPSEEQHHHDTLMTPW